MNVDVYAVCYDLHYRLHETYKTVLYTAVKRNNDKPLLCESEKMHSRVENNELIDVKFESVIIEQNQVKVRAAKKFSDGTVRKCAYPLYMLTLEEILTVMKEMV